MCTATDSHRNAAASSFTITVHGAHSQILDLEANVDESRSLTSSPSLSKLLLKDLAAADNDLTAGHRRSACTDLAAFADAVQRNTKPRGPIAKTEAASWQAATTQIKRVAGC